MRAWVAIGVTSLTASFSLAADLPERDLIDLPRPATHATFPETDLSLVLLGQKLFYDPLLSGDQTTACASCHAPRLATTDGMSLSLGASGSGIGAERTLREGQSTPGAISSARLPRNTPALWNLGARQITTLGHDGQVEALIDAPHGVALPDGLTLPAPITEAQAPLTAQVLMSLIAADRMAGAAGDNPVADAVARNDATAAWATLPTRVNDTPGYASAFAARNAGAPASITQIAEAIASFIAYEFRSINSPFDRYLAGDDSAMSAPAQIGMALFYGEAGCSSCHAGLFQTDQGFHAIGTPQIGPGMGGEIPYADTGRHRVTGALVDYYRFRTPTLRNVSQTAPYGHSGAFATLTAMLLHHLGPVDSLMTYDRAQARLHPLPLNDFAALDDEVELFDIAAAIEITPLDLTEADIRALLAFLDALTDEAALSGRLGAPEAVPSGLPVAR